MQTSPKVEEMYVNLASPPYFTLTPDMGVKKTKSYVLILAQALYYARTADFSMKNVSSYLPLSFWSSSLRSGPACMKTLSDTGFLSVRDSLLVFTMAVQFSNATSPFLRKQGKFIAG